ncbi:MAG TPA: 2'-5' RNA ligase family protein [Pseudosphingobacterium sp.]|nr:2'-5' RNA ligase family protein [Pseudosphingobacterium sp.]
MKSKNQLTLFEEVTYFILISPAERIREWIIDQKRRLHAEIQLSDFNLYAIPHISLYKIKMEDNDEMIKRKVSTAIAAHTSFHQPLSGIEYLTHGNVSFSVCVKVVKPERIVALYQSLRETFKFKKTSFHPHLTIARDIDNNNKHAVQRLFPMMMSYEDSFFCDNVLILKKNLMLPDSKYEVIFNGQLK